MREPVRRALVIVGLLGLLFVGSIALSLRTESLGNDVRVIVEPEYSGILITNSGSRIVAVSVWHQTLGSNVWTPPKEELFTVPYHVLKPEDYTRMVFTNVLEPGAEWRAMVLYQKFYDDGPLGKFQYFVDSRIAHRERFSTKDHRGAQDEFHFTETLKYNGNGVSVPVEP